MDSLSFPPIGELVHDDNCIALLRANDCACSDDGNIDLLVVVDTLYVDLFTNLVDNTYIFSGNSAISPAIYECTAPNAAVVVMGGIYQVCHLDLSVSFSINLEFLVLGMGGVLGRHVFMRGIHG